MEGVLHKAALLRVFLRTVPLFSMDAEPRLLGPPPPPATWRPDRRVVEDGGGGVVDVPVSRPTTGPLTELRFEFRLFDL